jgi:hypothetical protein
VFARRLIPCPARRRQRRPGPRNGHPRLQCRYVAPLLHTPPRQHHGRPLDQQLNSQLHHERTGGRTDPDRRTQPRPDAISSRCSGAKIHEDSGAKTLDDTHFHGLHPDSAGSALPTPTPKGGPITTPQASLDATDRSVAPPTRALDAGLRPDPFPDQAASLLPGLLAATRTGLSPAGDDELTTTDHLPTHGDLLSAGRTKDRG